MSEKQAETMLLRPRGHPIQDWQRIRDACQSVAAEESIPHNIGKEFGTLAGPASSRDLIGRNSGTNNHPVPIIGRTPLANGASRTRQNFQKAIATYAIYMKHCSLFITPFWALIYLVHPWWLFWRER
ncbi:hypothetical protein T265_05486 [Opisthorchis viverrini]|uniref:Uncharacterized protein n=1 Tax=Opisthorchis viverrini TaxID=6198 RepID=A0A075AF78_OPIVI|nr:hypothetical protein T265_05486 [Opisthorchis viverrini]KER27444.1 hypothetical protein T265_05486 [Opisthorchis viverrini]